MDEQMALPETVRLLRAMAGVTGRFRAVAQALAAEPVVTEVTSGQLTWLQDRVDEETFRVGSGDGVRQEWDLEASVGGLRSVGFCVEVGWLDGGWTLHAAATGYVPEGIELRSFPLVRTADLNELLEVLEARTDDLLQDAARLCQEFARR